MNLDNYRPATEAEVESWLNGWASFDAIETEVFGLMIREG